MPKGRRWYEFWKGDEEAVFEQNIAHDVDRADTHELNTSIQAAYMMTLFNGEPPYTIEQIRTYLRNPAANIEQIRRMSDYAYYSNGVITSAIDYMRAMHTLDSVIVSKSKARDGSKPRSYARNKARMEATLNAIRYKQLIRDAIFKDAKDGMYIAYFETRQGAPDLKRALSDYEVANIMELNDTGLSAMVIPLPLSHTKIISRRNNVFQVAFDLRYFDGLTEDALRVRLAGFPKEIQDGWDKYTHSQLNGCWLPLSTDHTIVSKIKCGLDDPYGIPFSIAALDDINYAQYFIDTKRNVLDSVNNQIVYQTFPEGKEKGTSALTQKQQQSQHDLVKSALQRRQRNINNTSFFSLAAGTKLDKITLDIDILDEKNETAIKEDVNRAIGVSASALDGSSTGNYSTANLNLELVAANVYTWIEEITEELNKCINRCVIKDKACRVEFYVLPITMVNRDKMVGYMNNLYAQGKGSLTAWIASTGFNPDNYIALMDYELEEDFENRYPVHRTSYTVSGSTEGGRPESESDDPASVQQKTNGANGAPKPSG